MTLYLYLKTHKVTGMRYLGKTKQDPFTYKGSGKYWLNHVKKHGNDVITEILLETTDSQELKEKGMYYSLLWKITTNPKFANIVNEEGGGGDTSMSEGYQRGIKNRKLANSLKYKEGIKNRDTSKVSQLRKGRALALEFNLKWYNNGETNIYVTEGTQPANFVRGRIMPCGRTLSEKAKEKLSVSNGKRCISPKGEIFNSTKLAGKAYNVTDVAIRGLIKRGVSGWKYL